MTPLEGAKLMVERGFKVFPLPRGKKAPPPKNWQKIATDDIQQIELWGECNFGVITDGYTVVDFDINETKGINGLAEYQKLYGDTYPLAKSLTVKTPRGGAHVYYSGSTRNTTGTLALGVDTRSDGGYTVAPGSDVNGKPYEVIADVDIARVPAWIEDQVVKGKKPLVRPLDEDSAGYIPDGERNNELTRWAGVLRSQGLSREEMFYALQAINERRCASPLSDFEVRAIANSIGNKPFKIAQAEAEFSTVDTKAALEVSAPKHVSEFDGEPPTRNWVIENWLPEGEITSLYGAGSVGKSLVSLQLGVGVATGGKWMGLECMKMPVMYVACEDTKDELHIRCHSVLSAGEYEFEKERILDAPLYLWSRVGQENDLAIERNNDVVKGRFLPVLESAFDAMGWEKGLLILDTVSDIYLGSEIDRAQVNKFIKTILGELRIKRNLTILLLAHPSRSGTALKDGLSGSTAWDAAVRSRWWMRRNERDSGYSVLERVKSNYALVGEELILAWDAGRFIRVGDAKDPVVYALIDAILDVLLDDGEYTLFEVARWVIEKSPLIEGSVRTVERRIESLLMKHGEITKGGKKVTLKRKLRGSRMVKRLVVSKEEMFD